MMSWRTASNTNGDQESILRQRSSLDAEDEPDINCRLPDGDENNTISKDPHPPRHHERLEAATTGSSDANSNGAQTSTTASSSNIVGKKRSSDTMADIDSPPPLESIPQHLADDDGGDHAMEAPSTVIWKPQNTQTTCEFTHVIKEYASKRESGCKKAEYSEITVDELGNRWRLIIYVNGNGRASNHHLSLFLQVADAEDLPFGWKKAVSYVLTLEHPENPSLGYAKRNPDKTFKLCPKAIDWGWSQFITSDRIQQEGFVTNDSLSVRASVSVKSSSVSIDEEDAELYLKCAVEEGNAAAVKLCIDQGASVNCQFKDDLYTPLHTACSSNATNKKGSMEVLHLLLEEGADGNACNKWRETPLLIAANNGHLDAVDALLKHNADSSLCSEAGWSALTFAAHKGYDDIVALLLKAGAPVNTLVTEDNSTPLHKACAGSKPGHLAAVKLLLANDADVSALNKWRETPLLTAANHGQAGAVEALLLAGAETTKCTDTGWSPLSIAAYKGHDEVVRLLLEAGAPTEEDDSTLSALLQAATKGLPDTVELLLRHGADHTVTTKKGDTALSILVEQNLIDIAVEMVTEYNAQISQCSRDGKKRQRAKLLIKLRVKQMEKEGRKFSGRDEDETDESDREAVAMMAQHDIAGRDVRIKSKQKKNNSNDTKESAEARARVAEEALLKELELEELQAKKEEDEACFKRDKKRKKKEKDRQQKLREDQERRFQEEEQVRKREAARKAKEEHHRKEQEMKLIEQREREMREAIEREKVLLAKRKERERREREQAKLKEREASSSPCTNHDNPSRPSKPPKTMKNGSLHTVPTSNISKGTGPSTTVPVGRVNNAAVPPTKVTSGTSDLKGAMPPGRRWETKPVQAVAKHIDKASPSLPVAAPVVERAKTPPALSPLSGSSDSSVQLGGVGPDATKPSDSVSNGSASQYSGDEVDHPAVALLRRDKVLEMLQYCNSLAGLVEENVLKRVMYRWVVRAAHDSSQSIDPLIPSWRNFDNLVESFQRQLISETSRAGSSANFEVLKNAGASVASFCTRLAREVEQLHHQVSSRLSEDWSDADIGMTAEEVLHGNERFILIVWAGRSSVKLPLHSFHSLRDRHVGSSKKFLTAVFVAKVSYESFGIIAHGTSLDAGLTTATQSLLHSDAFVMAQLWADPFSVTEGNAFWGKLAAVDRLFGGNESFGKEGRNAADILATRGGAVSVVPPLDNLVAARYVKVMLDLLEATSSSNTPLSFLVFLPADCFPLSRSGPSSGDLHLLDSRLGDSCRSFVQHVECLEPGKHFYRLASNGARSVSQKSSLLVLLQNSAGKDRFNCPMTTVRRIIDSFSTVAHVHGRIDNRMVSPIGFPGDLAPQTRQSPRTHSGLYFQGITAVSPEPQVAATNAFAAIRGQPIGTTSFSPANDATVRASRHGRIFDLVDDNDEDQTTVDVDVVSGMLGSLDLGLYQGADVDIESICLMGFGER